MNFWEGDTRPFADGLDAAVGIVASILALAGLAAFVAMVVEVINNAS